VSVGIYQASRCWIWITWKILCPDTTDVVVTGQGRLLIEVQGNR